MLDSLATVKTPGEIRTMDQRRADALIDVFARVLGDPDLPERHGHRPAVQVTAWPPTRPARGAASPARHCEIDHANPWSTGGETGQHTLHPLCRRHHHARHNAGWTVRRTATGKYHWTDPTGHAYTVHPDDG